MKRLPTSLVPEMEVEPASPMRQIAGRHLGRGDHLTISYALPQELQKRWTGIIAAEVPIDPWEEEADLGGGYCTTEHRLAG